MHYFPIALPFLLLFALLFIFLIIFIEIGILRYAYERIGVGRRHMLALLVLSFLGSYVNIPLFHLPAHKVASGELVNFFGMSYVVPIVKNWPGTIIAVNLGGAVIPTFLSIYLMVKNRLFREGFLAVAIVTFFVYLMAYPVQGVGIAIPVFVPPLIAAGIALLISRQFAPPLAYIAGSLGTLLGADVLNLEKIQALGAPIASIGGAGTFDGIFMTGILSVLMAGLVTRTRSPIR
jgi:uncharacterized membrane protein